MPKKKKDSIDYVRARAAGFELAASDLFSAIEKEYGEATAKEIFSRPSTFSGKASQAEWGNYLILHRWDRLPEPRNTMDLVNQLSKEGLGTVATVEHRVRELLRKRERAIAQGTWPPFAPPWPWHE